MRFRQSNLVIFISLLLLLAGCSFFTPTPPAPPKPPRAAPGTQPPPPIPPATATAAPPRPPLFADGFEGASLDPWEHGDGAILSKTAVHSGSQAVQISNDYLKMAIKTRPGAQYKLTAWTKLVSETGTDWGGFRFEADDSRWKPLAQSRNYLLSTSGDQWFKVALTFQASSDLTHVQAGYFGGPGRKLVADLDDFAILEKGANQPPVIQASLSTTAVQQLPAEINYSMKGDDSDGAIVRAVWDFGDGSRSFQTSGAHKVTSPGDFLARLKVVDDDGAVAIQTVAWTASSPGYPAVTLDQMPEEVHTSDLQIQGSLQPADAQMLVSTDRGFAAPIQSSARWKMVVPLSPGLNRILVQASGSGGKMATLERQVRFTPSSPLQVTDLSQNAASIEQWKVLELSFDVANSAATNADFPYDPALPSGLQDQDGISVDGLFSPDGWKTTFSRPAFLDQPYDRENKDNAEWLYPNGARHWVIRFAPPQPGQWQYQIRVRDAHGEITTPPGSFTVSQHQPDNHGPIRVSSRDPRYFEFADQTPFLGSGMNVNFSPDSFSFDASQLFDQISAPAGQPFLRWWLGGDIWGSAWQPWNSRTLDYDGYLPATGLTLDSAYGDGLASLKLDSSNPLMLQGWNSGHASLVPGGSYRLRVRWRTVGITGPKEAGQPYGLTIKLTGWPELGKTGSFPALIPLVQGDTPWHVAQGDFQAESNYLDDLSILLENTTGGSAYVDEISLYPILPDGSLGPQILRDPRFNSYLTFDERRAAGIDAILADAAQRGVYFKLVISEKDEFLLNHLGPAGLPDPLGDHFFDDQGTANHWLQQAYWRYLSAHYGAYPSVQSWELVTEVAPSPGPPFRLAADLAKYAAADGDPHLATISTWATLAEPAWKDPASAAIPYVDFHQYISPDAGGQAALDDTSLAFSTWDSQANAAAFKKPVVWGEMGISATSDHNKELEDLAKDTQGVWLHKLTWARSGPGGVYPLYWFPDNILKNHLWPVFAAWNQFMQGIPINNGHYQDAAASPSTPDLRVLGQKDLQARQAYLWIDNTKQTWKTVVDQQTVPPVSGAVRLTLGAGVKEYQIDWYDTNTGAKMRTETIFPDASGAISIAIQDLATDAAVKIYPASGN